MTGNGGAIAHPDIVERVPFFEEAFFFVVTRALFVVCQATRERRGEIRTDNQFAVKDLYRQVFADDLAEKECLADDNRLVPKSFGEFDLGRCRAEVTAKALLEQCDFGNIRPRPNRLDAIPGGARRVRAHLIRKRTLVEIPVLVAEFFDARGKRWRGRPKLCRCDIRVEAGGHEDLQ